MDEQSPDDVVLRGESTEGLSWSITAAGDDLNFSTMLRITRDGKRLAGFGMGGPRLYGTDVMNSAYGHSDDLPFYELVRVVPAVDRVVARTSAGSEVVLALSEPFPEFGLRFGAALLPPGEEPGELSAEVAGEVVQTE